MTATKNQKVKVNLKKSYTHQILVVQFSSICLLSIKRVEGRAIFTQNFPTFMCFYLFDLFVEIVYSLLLHCES